MSTLFKERMHPGLFTCAVAAIFGAMLGVILVPVSEVLGLVTSAVCALAAPALLWFLSPTVAISGTTVSAGKAHIDVSYLGEPRVLDADQLKDTLGPNIRPHDFRVVRGWVPTGIEVPVTDPQDPTPAWILSLRNPEDFVIGFNAARTTNAASHGNEAASD